MDADPRLSTTVFVVFSDDWGRHPSSCQHLFRRIVPHAQVLWVNTVGLRVPRLSVHDLKRGAQVVRSWLAPARGAGGPAREHSPNPAAPEVLRPIMWPSFRRRWSAALNQRLLSRAVTKALGNTAAGKRAILVSTLPIVPALFRESRFVTKVYYCVDDFTQWHGIDGDAMRRLEKDTLAACDLLIATSTPILESRGPLSRRSILLTHGVDVDHFARAIPNPASPLATLPHPIVGMFGVFDRRIDAGVLMTAARALPDATFAVVGPVVDRDPGEFRTVPNVRFLGAFPYDDLAGHVAHFDVCALPYVLDATTHSINPLKLKEYLATGKPVVTTALPEAVALGEYLIVAPPGRFAEEVRRAAVSPPPPSAALERFLAGESWEVKANRFVAEILRSC
jgi:glycosyltransferase involved in cell wall biosynthesis